MTTFLSWLRQLNFDTLLDTLIVVLASLLCITGHESGHGLAAYWLGDDTAKRIGRIAAENQPKLITGNSVAQERKPIPSGLSREIGKGSNGPDPKNTIKA